MEDDPVGGGFARVRFVSGVDLGQSDPVPGIGPMQRSSDILNPYVTERV